MKLGDVLKKERTNKGLATGEVAQKLGIPEPEYVEIEAGETPAESTGPLLAQIAIKLETPTSRLLADSGKFADTKPGQAGTLIKKHRERRSKTVEQLAQELEIPKEELEAIEKGESSIEKYGPIFLGFAEQIEQPVFNLFYPCGLPFQSLDDYP